MTPEINSQIGEQIRELGDAIELRPGFYETLLKKPNDWAFLIQLQVVVEASIAHRVVKALNQEKAFDHVSRLAFDGKAGKLQLALSLGSRLRQRRRTQRVGCLSQSIRSSACPHRSDIGEIRRVAGRRYQARLVAETGTLEPGDEGTERDTGFPGFGAKLRHRLWLSAAVALAKMTDARIHAQLVRLQRELERSQRENLDTSRTTPRSLQDFYAQNDEGQ